MRKIVEWRIHYEAGDRTALNAMVYTAHTGCWVRLATNLRDFQRYPKKYFKQDISMFPYGTATSSPPKGVWSYNKSIEQGE